MPEIKMCKMPGCASYATDDGYCAKHHGYRVADAPKPRKPWDGANRPNDPLYNTQRWKVLRDKVRKERGECAICGTIHSLTVHHVVPPKGDAELFYDVTNLVVLCRDCHNRMTSAEQKP